MYYLVKTNEIRMMKFKPNILLTAISFGLSLSINAAVLPEATTAIKIPIAKKPSSKPMSIAYVPIHDRYYVADGGLAPTPGDNEAPTSKSEIHVYDGEGNYVHSAKPGYDNRSIYFNQETKQLETITYNISSNAGFTPNTGIFSLDLDEKGNLKETSKDVSGFNAAFGDSSTIPTYDAENKRYFAKQGRSNLVWVIDLNKDEKVEEIKLDLKAANVQFDDIADYHVAYTDIKGEELAILDIDHKAVLIFDIKGKYIGKSSLPTHLKLRAQNHIAGLGYSNGVFFVLNETEGEFGTFYGFKISDMAR